MEKSIFSESYGIFLRQLRAARENNSMTEGFHTKMELINRQAYGFRNFNNYRMRVNVLCA